MNIFNSAKAQGNIVQLVRTNDKHLTGKLAKNQPEDSSPEGFAGALSKAINGVNDLQQESTKLNQQMIVDPNSVDVHDVTIAMSKANMALSITKSVIDGAIKAYKEIINLR